MTIKKNCVHDEISKMKNYQDENQEYIHLSHEMFINIIHVWLGFICWMEDKTWSSENKNNKLHLNVFMNAYKKDSNVSERHLKSYSWCFNKSIYRAINVAFFDDLVHSVASVVILMIFQLLLSFFCVCVQLWNKCFNNVCSLN